MHLEIKISLHFNTIFQSKDPEKIITNIKFPQIADLISIWRFFWQKISLIFSLNLVGKSGRNNYDNLQEL